MSAASGGPFEEDVVRRFSAFLPAAAAAVQKQKLAGVAAAVLEAGGRLSRAVGELFGSFPASLRLDEGLASADWMRFELEKSGRRNGGGGREGFGSGAVAERKEGIGLDSIGTVEFVRPQGSVNLSSTYDSRTNDVESSLVARGDLWRAEASHSSSISRSDSAPLFLIQLGPVLFVRDTTLLFPVHLSKNHLIWYGFERKNGIHSVCPAYWSIQRRWFLMSMICLNPFSCSLMDMQFPNGQLRYVAGDGFTTRAFLPFCGGLLQAQGKFPGDKRLSFSFKNRHGTSIIPAVQWPDNSFSLQIVQASSWKRSGLMIQPAIKFSTSSTFGGSCPGLCMELIHSVNDDVGVICGYSHTARPSAFTSISIGRSKLNGNVAGSGLVIRVEAPLCHLDRPWFSVQMNSGIEF